MHAGGQSGLHVLSNSREKLTDSVSAAAGQCIGFYPVFKLTLQSQTINTDEARQCVDCFYALCDVLDILREAAVPHKVRPKDLQRAVLNHLRRFQACYGTQFWVPKAHLALHLALMLSLFGVLLSCFVHERKHKELKRFGTLSRAVERNPSCTNWDKGLLQNVLRVQLQDLHNGALPNVPVFSSKFRPAPKQQLAELRKYFGTPNADVNMSVEVLLRGYIHVHTGDVVSLTVGGVNRVGEVWHHLEIDTTYFSCVNIFQSLPAKNMFLVQDEPVLVETASIQFPVFYRRVDSTVLIV